jgi:hypothetical protein
MANIIIPIASDRDYQKKDLKLNRAWNMYMTETNCSHKWTTNKINKNSIDHVKLLWSCLNMFFVINDNKSICPLDLENSSRKELSFFQHDVYPDWDKVKSSKKCTKLQEIKILCDNSNQEFILYVILALTGETFGSKIDESYIQNIYGIRICPYKKPSIRLWIGDFSSKMIADLKKELRIIWYDTCQSKIMFSIRDLF